METQTSSTVDQSTRKTQKILKTKPVYFLIGFIVLSTVVAFMLGGYFIGKDKAGEKQESSTSIEEQVALDPVTLPDNPDNWTSYTLGALNMEIKLPEKLNKLGNWKVMELKGVEGSISCLSNQELKDGDECIGEILVVGSSSIDFSSNRDFTFTDAQGFTIENGIYYVKAPGNNKFELKDITFKSFENNSDFEIIKILGDATPVTPGEEYLGAIVNTGNSIYPGIAFKMKIHSEISEYEFDQILRSLKLSN